ncbi:MAG: efflux transporter outer membrane subunit [Steroidobacterales bacterium]
MNARLATLCVGGCLLTGCSLIPAYRAPANPAPPQYKELASESNAAEGWQVAHPADRSPRGDWWREFGDATLDALEAKVDASNPDLAAAADRYQQAHALALEARSTLLPTVSLQGWSDTDRQSDHRPLRSASQPDSYHDDLLGASASYEFDLWGRVRSTVTAGAATAQAASADLESVRLALHVELAVDYIALRAQDALRSLLEQTVDAYGRALKMTSTRFQGGISSGLDVAQAQTQLETARANLTDIIERRALLEHAIATLTGELASNFSIGYFSTRPGTLDLKLPDVPVAMPATLLERRPDVAAAERRMAADNAAVGIARAAFFPRITLAAVAAFESTQAAGLLGTPNRFWAIGPQGVLTLFDSGYRTAAVAQARAQFDEASNRYRSTVLSAFQEVEDALARQTALRKELDQQNAARSSAERALQLAMNRYEAGAVNYLQVVATQIIALQAERAALDLQTRQLQASVYLVRALGGGWQADWAVTALTMQTSP